VADQLAARDWSVTDLANSSGLNRSGIQRWKAGTLRPDVDNARRLAEAFGRPLLEVLVAADILTEEEAKLQASIPDPASLSNQQLLLEVGRRLDGVELKSISREQVEAEGSGLIAGPSPRKPQAATRRPRVVHGGSE
jgi:transcriptional regulator with XRE-family HTH domain